MAITVQPPTNTYAPAQKKQQAETDALSQAFLGSSDAAAPTSDQGVPAPAPSGSSDSGIPAPAPSSPAPAPSGGALEGAQAAPLEGTQPVPAPQTYDPNVALQQAAQRFQSRYGRAMTAEEQQQLTAAIGYTGAQVTQAQLDQAMSLIDSYGGGQQPGGPVEGTQPVQPGTPGLEGTQPVPNGIDPNAALQQAQSAFRARFGRDMTPEEQQQLVKAIGYTGGQMTQAQLDQAMQIIAAYGGGATPGTPGLEGTQPVPKGMDPNAALAQLQQAFLKKFGRAMTAQEQQWLIQMSGYTSGLVSDEQLAAAMDAINRYTGNQQQPFEQPRPLSPEEEEANKRLKELLGQKWGEVDPNDPALKGQRDAHELMTQRNATRKRGALAERAAARGGLASGGYDVDTERILQEQGESDQSFEAELYANELSQQRQRLLQGIEMAKKYGLQEDAQQLQEKLALLDIDLRKYLGRAQVGLGLLGLNQNDQHFYDDLGKQLLQLMLGYNQGAVNAVL